MTRFAVFVLIAALILGVAGCNTTGCLNNQSALPQAEMYSSASGTTITLNNVRISGVGAPNDSVLVSEGKAVSKIYLPMRSQYTSTSWCFHYEQEGISDPSFNDTIEFDYTSIPYFASEECGAMYFYRISEVRYTTHLMDSVVVTDSLITNVDLTQIKIYFRTAEPVDPEEPEGQEEPEE